MMPPTERAIDLLCVGLVVPSFIYTLITQFWNLPLKNGRGYFLGVEVAPGFYDGPDSRWLARYHSMVTAVCLVDFGALAAILAAGWWDWIPIWMGGTAVFVTTSMVAFWSWARYRVGSVPPVLPAALSLEPRRLGDYISWPLEALCLGVVVFSWWMLLQNDGPIALQGPLIMTWSALGLLPGKITVVRQGWPLPTERAEEHRTTQEAARRSSVRLMDVFGWFQVSVLFMAALRRAWRPARSVPAAEWLVVAVELAFGLLLLLAIVRQKRVLDMGRTLRPVGSWTPASGRARLMSRSGIVWFAVWFGGILLLMFFFRQ